MAADPAVLPSGPQGPSRGTPSVPSCEAIALSNDAIGGDMQSRLVSMLPTLIACGVLSVASTSAWTQERMKFAYSGKPESSKFTQTHAIDVGDVPGHQLRVGQLHVKYGADAPEYAGVKVLEA